MSTSSKQISSNFKRRGDSFKAYGSYNGNGLPDSIVLLGSYVYPCQDELICKVDIEDVPYFNAPVYEENKRYVGKIDEVFGCLRDYYVSIKPAENVRLSPFQKGQNLFVEPYKLIPLQRFLKKVPRAIIAKKKTYSNSRARRGDFSGKRGNLSGRQCGKHAGFRQKNFGKRYYS